MQDIKISLAAARVNAEMSQEDAAKALNVGRMTVSDWETGKQVPSILEAKELSELYKMPIENIFFKKKSFKTKDK